jgi:hypothetical protein
MLRAICFTISLLVIFVASSCAFKKSPYSLKSWQGKYFYEEEPIKAIAGYYMVMQWELNIHEDADKCIANLEVIGQQTYIKLQGEIVGDEKEISILYSRNIDGSSENLQHGDTLFKLNREGKELITKWAVLNPRLPENPEKNCHCFRQ